MAHFTVFVLACFVGYMVVWNVTPALHTPLMSVTNAVSSIIIIGALLQISARVAGHHLDRRPDRAHHEPSTSPAALPSPSGCWACSGSRAGDAVRHRHCLYIGATILFILALGGLSRQDTARRGNLFGIIGMAIALVATILGVVTANYAVLVGALAIGGVVGLVLARRVQMTQMPELVAILHSLVGLAAVLVGFANFLGHPAPLGRRPDDPRHRDVSRHPHRRGDVLRLGHRLRQAEREDRRQAAHSCPRGTC